MYTKVSIGKIEWFGIDGADVQFILNKNKFWAFCHPCDFVEMEIADVKISFLEVDLPEETFWNENQDNEKKIIPVDISLTEYCAYGVIIQINPIVIDCGDLVLENGDWINDSNVIGKYVYFYIGRLDIKRSDELV